MFLKIIKMKCLTTSCKIAVSVFYQQKTHWHILFILCLVEFISIAIGQALKVIINDQV